MLSDYLVDAFLDAWETSPLLNPSLLFEVEGNLPASSVAKPALLPPAPPSTVDESRRSPDWSEITSQMGNMLHDVQQVDSTAVVAASAAVVQEDATPLRKVLSGALQLKGIVIDALLEDTVLCTLRATNATGSLSVDSQQRVADVKLSTLVVTAPEYQGCDPVIQSSEDDDLFDIHAVFPTNGPGTKGGRPTTVSINAGAAVVNLDVFLVSRVMTFFHINTADKDNEDDSTSAAAKSGGPEYPRTQLSARFRKVAVYLLQPFDHEPGRDDKTKAKVCFASAENFDCAISFRRHSFEVTGSLAVFSLHDLTPETADCYRDVVTPGTVDPSYKMFGFGYTTYWIEDPQYPGYDTKLAVDVDHFRVVLLLRFVKTCQRWLSFLSKTIPHPPQKKVYRTKDRMKIVVSGKRPEMVLPTGSISSEFFTLDLGESIHVENNWVEEEDKEEDVSDENSSSATASPGEETPEIHEESPQEVHEEVKESED